jgi:hypothetical protein
MRGAVTFTSRTRSWVRGEIDLVFVSEWFSHLEARWDIPSFARFLQRLSSFSHVGRHSELGSSRLMGRARTDPEEGTREPFGTLTPRETNARRLGRARR